MQDQKSIGVKIQERNRKYEEDKKNPAINKLCGMRNEEIFPCYIQPTVKEVFKDLTDEPNDTKDFKSAAKLISRCLEKLEKGDLTLRKLVAKASIMSWVLVQKKLLKYKMLYLIILLTLDIV